jgi:hypothetical protein
MCDDLRTLIAPLHHLEPDETLRAIRVARGLGRAFGEEFGRCLTCLIGRGMPLRPNDRAYYTYLIEPSWDESGMDTADLRQWEEAFENGAALRDPRVQAFCTGLSECALEIAQAISQKRRLLAIFLEIRPERVAIHGTGPREQVVLGYGGERYLVLTAREAAAVLPLCEDGGSGATGHRGPGCLGVRFGGSGRPRMEESIFLDHWILRWSATGPESDAYGG